MTRVEVSYDFKLFPSFDKTIISEVGYPDDSGAGFGRREMGWTFPTAKAASSFVKKLAKFNLDVEVL